VTPCGIFQGPVTQFDVTCTTCWEWDCTTNRLGDQPLRGFDADIIARDADRVRIMEEVVTLAATGQ